MGKNRGTKVQANKGGNYVLATKNDSPLPPTGRGSCFLCNLINSNKETMAKNKSRFADLENIKNWTKRVKKDVAIQIKIFECAYHQELQRLQEYNNLSDITDCIQDLDATLDSLTSHINHAQDQVNCIKHVINETRTE